MSICSCTPLSSCYHISAKYNLKNYFLKIRLVLRFPYFSVSGISTETLYKGICVHLIKYLEAQTFNFGWSVAPRNKICSETFYPHFQLFKSDVFKLPAYTCVKYGSHCTCKGTRKSTIWNNRAVQILLHEFFITQSVEDPWTREKHSSFPPYFVFKIHDSDIYLFQLKICRSALDSPGADSVLKARIFPLFTLQCRSSLIPQKPCVLMKH